MPNAMIQRCTEARNEGISIGAHLMQQQIFDCLAIVLTNADVMGKDTFSPKRILKVIYGVRDIVTEYKPAWGNITADTDYCREQIDRRLKQIYGDDFSPWEERYPYHKKITYGGKK